jgi:hypothetical protein
MRLLVGSLVASVLSICACFFGSSCTFSVASLAFLLCLSSSCMFSCVELLPSAALSQPVLFSDHSSQLGEWFSACLWFLSVFLYDLLQYITPAFAHLGEKNTHTHTHTHLPFQIHINHRTTSDIIFSTETFLDKHTNPAVCMYVYV